jgi:iron complex outermembrane recepter protein
LFAAMLSAAMAGAAGAQETATVSGMATNALSGDAVPDATIVLDGPSFTRQARSGADGAFAIAGVPPGDYHLSVRADGYLPQRLEVVVAAGASASTDVKLSPEVHFTEVTSVSPDARSQFETFQATSVLGGMELSKEVMSTLGATIENQPGIALRGFGPGPARPIVRGMDGDRVLIVQDGLRMGDLSSQSGDHGVNVNPAAASRIEVVRGPATLLYGANAIGGLVNVITKGIPDAPVTKPTGSVSFDGGTNGGEAGLSGDLTIGRGALALHAAASGRRSGDFQTPDGSLANSFNRSHMGEVGLSYAKENGFFGGSYAFDRSHYGVPLIEEGVTNLDPRRQLLTLRGETRNMAGFFDSFRGSFGARRYRHDERDGDEVATSFANDSTELELLAHHRPVGNWKGSIGGAFLTRAFATEGEEVLSAAVDQKNAAAFVYEEFPATPHLQLQVGARLEHAMFSPKSADPERSFTNLSGSAGILVMPNDATTIAVNIARAVRNPALEELYFRGPHRGNNAFENGDTALESEQALGLEASFRWRSDAASGEATYFFNRINGFIFRELSGAIVEDLFETFFRQGDARLQGVESHFDLRVAPVVWVEGGLDYVRGDLRTIDKPLTRMPPLRGRAGVRYQRNALEAGLDGVFTQSQERIYRLDTPAGPIGETPTDGYTLFKVYGSYAFQRGDMLNTLTVRLDNAGGTRYRNHLNYLKDLTPEMGRSLRIVYGVRF